MISSLIGGGLTIDQSERTALLRASSLLPRGRGDTRGVHRGHGDSAERCCEGVHRGMVSLQRDVVREKNIQKTGLIFTLFWWSAELED